MLDRPGGNRRPQAARARLHQIGSVCGVCAVCGLSFTAPWHRPHVHPAAQQAKNRRQHSDRQRRRQPHRTNRAISHRLQKRLRENQQPRQSNRHHRSGEHHRLTGSRRRIDHGVRHRGASVQLFAETTDHKQAVVDRQTQAQQRHHGLREHIHLGKTSQNRQHTQGTKNGQHTHDQWHRRSNNRREHKQQQHSNSGQRIDLRAGNIAGHPIIQRVSNRRLARN